MSLYITTECINCDVCEEVCPNKAISFGGEIYIIDHNLCTECIGHSDKPACIDICPIDCIKKDPKHVESRDDLERKFVKLQAVNEVD